MEWVSSLGRHSLRAAGLVPRTVWCVGGCSATEGIIHMASFSAVWYVGGCSAMEGVIHMLTSQHPMRWAISPWEPAAQRTKCLWSQDSTPIFNRLFGGKKFGPHVTKSGIPSKLTTCNIVVAALVQITCPFCPLAENMLAWHLVVGMCPPT